MVANAGYRAFVPYLRGYGPTRFRDVAAPRTAEQAAIGQDVIDFADALRLPRFAVAGYDWGGRAAAIAAALHPDRVRATVLIGGTRSRTPSSPRRRARRRPSTAPGISGISTPSVDGPGCRRIGRHSAVCCGSCGRRAGASPTKRTIARRRRSTIPTSWTWSSIRTATAMGMRPGNRGSGTWRRCWRSGRGFRRRRSFCMEPTTALRHHRASRRPPSARRSRRSWRDGSFRASGTSCHASGRRPCLQHCSRCWPQRHSIACTTPLCTTAECTDPEAPPRTGESGMYHPEMVRENLQRRAGTSRARC